MSPWPALSAFSGLCTFSGKSVFDPLPCMKGSGPCFISQYYTCYRSRYSLYIVTILAGTKIFYLIYLFVYFGAGSHASQAHLKLPSWIRPSTSLMVLPLLPRCWDYGHLPRHPVRSFCSVQDWTRLLLHATQALCKLSYISSPWQVKTVIGTSAPWTPPLVYHSSEIMAPMRLESPKIVMLGGRKDGGKEERGS